MLRVNANTRPSAADFLNIDVFKTRKRLQDIFEEYEKLKKKDESLKDMEEEYSKRLAMLRKLKKEKEESLKLHLE